MKVEITLNKHSVMKLAREIVALEDALKLLEKALPKGSHILKDVATQISAYRSDFTSEVYEDSNMETVAITLYQELEFGIRSGAFPK